MQLSRDKNPCSLPNFLSLLFSMRNLDCPSVGSCFVCLTIIRPPALLLVVEGNTQIIVTNDNLYLNNTLTFRGQVSFVVLDKAPVS